MDTLPDEILDKLLSKLQIEDLCTSRLVSRNWNDVAVLSLRKLHDPITFFTQVQVEQFTSLMENRIQSLPYSTFTFYFPFSGGTTTTRPEVMTNFGISCEESIPNHFNVLPNYREREQAKCDRLQHPKEPQDKEKEELRRGESLINLVRYSPSSQLLNIHMTAKFRICRKSLGKLPILEHLTKLKYTFEAKSYAARESLLEGIVTRAPFLKELILCYFHDRDRYEPPDPPASHVNPRQDILQLPGLLKRLPASINFGILFGLIYFDGRYLGTLRELVDLDRRFVYFKFILCILDWRLEEVERSRIRGLFWDWLEKNRTSLLSLNIEWGWGRSHSTFDFLPPILPECTFLKLGIGLHIYDEYNSNPDLYKCFPNLRRLVVQYSKDLKPLLSNLPKLEDLELWGSPEFDILGGEDDKIKMAGEAELLGLLHGAPANLNYSGPFGEMRALKFLTIRGSFFLTHSSAALGDALNLLRMLVISARHWIHRLQRLYFNLHRPLTETDGTLVEYRDLLSTYHDEVVLEYRPRRTSYNKFGRRKLY